MKQLTKLLIIISADSQTDETVKAFIQKLIIKLQKTLIQLFNFRFDDISYDYKDKLNSKIMLILTIKQPLTD